MAEFRRTGDAPPPGGQQSGAARFQAVSGNSPPPDFSGKTGQNPSSGFSNQPGRTPDRQSDRERQRRDQQIGRVQNTRRRRRHGNYIIYYILLGLILTVVCVVLSMTVFFNVQTISPTGSTVYSKEEILAVVDAKAGDNLLRLNTDKLAEKALAVLTKAESVEVKRHFPDQLDIVVTDGKPVLQVSESGSYYQFTESGRLIGITSSAVVDAQVVVGPDVSGLTEGQYMNGLTKEQQQSLSTWRTITDELWDYSIHDISAMNLSDELRLRLYYQNRIEIDIGALTDMDAKMATLKAILYDSGTVGVDETGKIDLTNPDRVYFNNQTACSPPTGAAQAGWTWNDPYSELLEQVLYAPKEPDPPADDAEPSEDGNGEEGEDTGAKGSEPSEDDTSSETSDDSSSSEESYETSGGMRLPQLPNVGGTASQSTSSAPSYDSLPASGSVSSSASSDNSSAGTDAAGDSSGSGTTSNTVAGSTAGNTVPGSTTDNTVPGSTGVAGSAGSSGSGNTGVGTQAPSVPSIGG